MTDISSRNFGYLIAYVIPGFIVVATLSRLSPTMHSWIGAPSVNPPTVGGFLYVTIASVLVGMMLGAVRWLLLDTLHHHTGVEQPRLDFATYRKNHAAFATLVVHHFRYYEFFGHSALALIVVAVNPNPLLELFTVSAGIAYTVIIALIALMIAASRNALQKYYDRTNELMAGERARANNNKMDAAPI